MSMYQKSIERYQNDAAFRQLVGVFYSILRDTDFTPAEIREAALVASIKQEMESVRSLVVTKEDYENLRPDLRETWE